MPSSTVKLSTLLLVLAISTVAVAVTADPTTYHAEYRGEYQGLPIRATGLRELALTEDGHYRLSSSARSALVTVTEYSDFKLVNNQPVPLAYYYGRKGLGKNKEESLTFDWDNSTVSENAIMLVSGIQDKLSYQEKLRVDVNRAIHNNSPDIEFAYDVVDDEKIKTYRFRLAGEEVLATPLGDLRTMKVERIRSSGNRQTTLWLAMDHECLLVRLKQAEKKRGFELNLQSATVSGIDISTTGAKQN